MNSNVELAKMQILLRGTALLAWKPKNIRAIGMIKLPPAIPDAAPSPTTTASKRAPIISLSQSGKSSLCSQKFF